MSACIVESTAWTPESGRPVVTQHHLPDREAAEAFLDSEQEQFGPGAITVDRTPDRLDLVWYDERVLYQVVA